jgi:hypothetical protein
MKKVLLFVTLLIGSVSFGQTISINGSLHSTNGDNTFPIWVEEGTTIQPNSPIKSISIKEFNVVPNSNGNDLVFNKTVLVYSDSVSIVPEGKTWKLESIQNGLQIGDEYAGGIVFYLDGNGGGKVIASNYHYWGTDFNIYDREINGFDDWFMPNIDDLINIFNSTKIINKYHLTGKKFWSSDTYDCGPNCNQTGNHLYIDSDGVIEVQENNVKKIFFYVRDF